MAEWDPYNPSLRTIAYALRVGRYFSPKQKTIVISIARDVLMHSRNLDDSEGIAALDDGLLSASLDLVLENEFCSYSKSQCDSLVAAALMHEEELRYINDVLILHSESLNLLYRLHTNRAIGENVRSRVLRSLSAILPRYSHLWEVLYEFRLLLYRNPAPGFDFVTSTTQSFRESLVLNVTEAVTVLSRHLQYVSVYTPKLACVLMDIWINSCEDDHRYQSLFRLSVIPPLHYTVGGTRTGRMVMEEAARCGAISPKALSMCLRRDLRDERFVGNRLLAIGSLFFAFPTGSRIESIKDDSPYDQKLFDCVLGAARRNLCRDSETESVTDRVHNIRFLFLRICEVAAGANVERPPLSEKEIHEVISICALGITQDMQDAIIWREMAAVEHCFRLLRRQQRENTPEMEAIRRLTFKVYEGSVQKLSQASSELAETRGVRTWMGLGSYIPREGPRIVNRWTPPLLKRCGWQECLCSVYKPAHRMRICNGCCKVAYCGDRCQKQDWNRGGHKEQCPSRQQ